MLPKIASLWIFVVTNSLEEDTQAISCRRSIVGNFLAQSDDRDIYSVNGSACWSWRRKELGTPRQNSPTTSPASSRDSTDGNEKIWIDNFNVASPEDVSSLTITLERCIVIRGVKSEATNPHYLRGKCCFFRVELYLTTVVCRRFLHWTKSPIDYSRKCKTCRISG
jgi:hypothetical protein